MYFNCGTLILYYYVLQGKKYNCYTMNNLVFIKLVGHPNNYNKIFYTTSTENTF